MRNVSAYVLFCSFVGIVRAYESQECHETAESVKLPYVGAEAADPEKKVAVMYTAFDDASWPVTSSNMSDMFESQRLIYENFIDECIQGRESCEYAEEDRLGRNANQPRAMVNYTEAGYKKRRAPEALFSLLREFWEANKDRARLEENTENPYQNTWQVPTTIVMVEEDQFVGGGRNLSAAVWVAAREVLEEWTGQKLAGSSVYGIRVYHNGSILTPHVDRLPLVSSAIINVAQDVEEDWPLEVYGHDGKATNVTMKPGDMVLYESHSVIHGRPFPLKGNYYANIFVHFEPMGEADSTEPLPEEGGTPPYLGSEGEGKYFEETPDGWTLLTDIEHHAVWGDLYTLKYIAQRDPMAIADSEKKFSILQSATTNRHINILDYLLNGFEGYNINTVSSAMTILDHALASLSEEDAVVEFLRQNGGETYQELIKSHPELVTISDSRCTMINLAVNLRDREDVLEFLFEVLEFDVNTVCDGKYTALDMLLNLYQEDEPRPTEDTDVLFAYLSQNGGMERLELEEDFDAGTDRFESRCSVMFEAVEFESLEVLDFLILSDLRFDVNMVCGSQTPLDMAQEGLEEDFLLEDEPIVEYFLDKGAVKYQDLPREADVQTQGRCSTIAAAIKRGASSDVFDFLFLEAGYNANMLCSGITPLDIAQMTDQNLPVLEMLRKHGAKSRKQLTETEL